MFLEEFESFSNGELLLRWERVSACVVCYARQKHVSDFERKFLSPLLLTEMKKDEAEYEEFKTALGLYIEDPWERVKFIFSKNAYGERHPDFLKAMQSAQMGFFAGGVIGGFIYQGEYLNELKRKSDAKIYHNKLDAYRQLSQESMLGFIKGFFKWGPKIGVFVGGFILFTSCTEAYRNKSGVLEYSVGGSLIGSALRFNFGVRGMVVGGLVGTVLGTIYGLAQLSICKLTQADAVQIKYGQFALSKYIEKQVVERIGGKKETDLTRISRPSEILNPLDSVSLNEEEQDETKKKEVVK